jgi:spore maturation protein CgeB
MKVVVFGLSLSSSWGNGHATTYRALLSAFAARGHEVTFYEWDAPWYRGAHRDLPDPSYCRLELFSDWCGVAARAVAESWEADAVMVGSYVRDGIRIIDALASGGVDGLYFYDIDTPVTVAALRGGGAEYLRPDQVPLFARYLSFTGGPFLTRVLQDELGARDAQPLYCSVDADRYRPLAPDPALACDLAYMGTYAPDRQPTLERLLVDVARRLPRRRFCVAGPQYPEGLDWPDNVRRIAHLPPERHPAFYGSSSWQLNVTRSDMIAAGWSPSVRLFEAGACGAAMVSDAWPGLEEFFVPGREIELAERSEQVIELIEGTPEEARRALGASARRRVLESHTAARRAEELEALLTVGAAAA